MYDKSIIPDFSNLFNFSIFLEGRFKLLIFGVFVETPDVYLGIEIGTHESNSIIVKKINNIKIIKLS